MSNEVLFQRIKKLVAVERRIGVEILELLYEIESRKAYAELRYDGLFTYCVKELGFSDSQAYQRIQAMRAVKELPELKEKVEEGALSVTTVSKVRTHIRREEKEGKTRTEPEKLELFTAMENKTSREVEERLAEERGEKLLPKLVLEMDEELEALWRKVKGLAAHRSGGDEAKVLKLLAEEWLKRNDPAREPQRVVPFTTQVAPQKKRSRYIPARVRREVWQRDQSKCVRCGSAYAVEPDHFIPFAEGGSHEVGNLRLHCRSCNQYRAIARFGVRRRADSRPGLRSPRSEEASAPPR